MTESNAEIFFNSFLEEEANNLPEFNNILIMYYRYAHLLREYEEAYS